MALRFWTVLASTLVLAGSTYAAAPQSQPNYTNPKTQPGQPPKKEQLTAKGEFDAAAPTGIKAQLNGETWAVMVVTRDKDPKNLTKVHVVGTAEADFLAPQMYVRFSGEFDKKGKATAEIKDLEIFFPDDKNLVGANPTGNGFDDPGAKKAANATTAYAIAGVITAVKKNNITVNCGTFTAKADVAADAKIKVDVPNFNWASPQDKIEVKGWYYNKGYVVANEVNIALSQPLTAPKKRGATHPVSDKTKAAGDKTTGKIDSKKTDDTADEKKPDDKKADDKSPKKPADASKPDAADATKADPKADAK